MFFKKPEVDSTNLYAEPAPIDPANEASSLEVFKAYKDDVRATGNAMSSSYNIDNIYEDHNRMVKELTGEELPNPRDESVGVVDYDRLKEDYSTYQSEGGTEMASSFTSRWIEQEYRKKLETLAEKYPDKRSQILPDQSFISQSYGRRGEALERSQEIYDKSGGDALDWAARASGSAYGALHDPVTWLTMPFGFGGVGLGAKGLAMGFLKTGAINAASEAIIQPGIQSEQNRAGLPSGLGPAATAIGGAFLLGGALDLGIRGSFRAIAPQFGFAPITKDGIVVAWRKPGQASPSLAPDAAPIAPEFDPELMKRVDAGDPEAQAEVLRQINGSSKKTGDTVIPNSLIERAEGGDLEAARGIAETIAKDDPYAAQALYGADADARLAEIPDPLIAPGEHVRVTNQSLRHVVDPENEPMPARVFADPVLPERLPAIEAELAALRTKVDDPTAAQQIASLEAEVQMIARFGRDPVASAELLRSNPGMMTADLDPSLPAVKTSVALSKLSDDAFGQVRSGQAPVELAEMVSDYVPDPLMQSRVLADLTAMKPVHEIQAKSRLQELLRSPEYNPVAPVADDGKTRLIDDPYGAEAKAQLQGLEQTFKEEMSSQGMAPSIEEMMLTPEGQKFAATRAAEIDSIIEEMTGIAPKQTTISRFDTIDDLPPTLRGKVRQANAVRFAEQFKRFMGAKSEAEALSIRTELDAAGRNEGIDGIADGDTIWIAAFAQNPRAKIAHEIVHALKGTKQLLPEEEAILAAAARDVGVFSKEREALYREAYADRANVDEVLSEEAAAHYIEAYVRGDIPVSSPINVKAASIVDKILEFAGKVKEALGLKGYRAPASDTPVDPARDVVAAILSGEVAKREIASSIDASAAKAAKLEDQAIGQSMFSMREDMDSLGYYSGALRAARNLAQDKGTPEQMLAMLKKGGAKDAELEATGLAKFIGSRGTDDAAGSGAVNETPWSKIKEIDAALDGDMGRAIDEWVGGPHDTIAKGLEGGLMVPERLENASDTVLDGVAKPIRDLLRAAHGDTITVYRGELDGGKQSTGRKNKLVSYTTDRRVAEKFAGARAKPVKVWSAEEIAAAEKQLAETGEAKLGRTTFRRQEQDSKYVDMYDESDGFITDTKSIRAFAEDSNTDAAELNGERSANIERVRAVEIPVDSVVWATDRFNQKEIIAKAGNETNVDRSSGTSGSAKRMNQITKSEIIKHLEDNKVKVNENIRRPMTTMEGMNRRQNGIDDEAKWSSYSLDPSNPTYRETVLHLPETRVAEIDARLGVLNDEISSLSGGKDIPQKDMPRFSELRAEAKALSDERANLKRGNFQSGHFSEPNIIGHMMTSMTKHEGKPVYTIDQIQSDWGQKLRDGGVRDEAKIAELKKNLEVVDAQLHDAAMAHEIKGRELLQRIDPGTRSDTDGGLFSASKDQALSPEMRKAASDWLTQNYDLKNGDLANKVRMTRAELRTAEASTPGNPLVNTTDQWTNTTLRRAIRQAAEANAEYIAIPSGDTVLSYNPGDTAGMRGFYGATKVRDAATYERLKAEMDLAEAAYNKALNAQKEVQRRNAERTTPNSASELKAARKSVDDTAAAFDALRKDFKAVEDASDRLIDGIVPKNLRKILTKIDKDTPKPQIIETLDSPNKTGLGQGFTLFKLTDKVKQSVMTEGQPLFGIRDTADQNHVMASDKGAGIYLSAKAGKPGYGYTASGEAMLVTVDPARMMVWNSSEHTPEVRRALDAVGAEHGISISGKSGKTAYRTLAEKLGDDKASEAFLNAGIQGHTQTVKGFDNSVVFDPELVKPDPLNAGAAAPEADQPDMAAQLAEFLTPENLGRLSDDLDVNDPAQAMALAERFAPVLKQYGIDVQQAMPLIQRAMAGEDPQAMLPELMAMAPELDDAMIQQGMDAAQGMAGGDAPMFSMRDDQGRIKRGAERRAKVLATDIQQIEADLKAGAVDQREALQRKRASFLNAKSEEAGLDDVIKYRSPRGQEDLAIGFLRMHESLGKENAPFADVATLRQDIAKQAIGKMSEVMWELRKGALRGDLKRVKNAKVRTRMENMIREAAGEKTSDPIAARMAKAWLDTAEWLRQSFNAAGGDIQKLNGWFAPQYHDAELLLGAGRKAWVARMMGDGVLDRARMVKRDGTQMSDAELKEMLEDIWSTITTDGANKRDVTDSFGKGALYKRHAEHRVLHFKDADAFMNYAKEFGRSDPYSMMVGHIQMMARDIAALRRFGANPELVRDRVKQHILLDAKEGRSARSVFDDLSDSISDLKAQLASIVTPAEKAMAKMSEIHTRLDKIVGKPRFNTEREALRTELFKVHEELQLAMATKATTPEQKALTTQISALLDEMDQLSETQPVMDKNPEQRARRIIARADEMWKQFNGTTNVPTDGFMAGAMSAGRNWVSSSVLSFASISSITDQATSLAARAFIGMPVTRQLGSFIKGFTKEDRQFALRAGVGLDQAMNAFAVSTRFMGFANTAHLTGYITDRTHSFSGLAAMTQASKIAFASDFMSWMAELSKKSYGGLPSWTREMMNRHGFTEADFTALKTVTPEMHRGVAVLTRPAVARDLGEDVAERYMRMLLREQAMAVLEPTIQGRTAFISETKPGTIIGEMARSVAMLKSFPTSYTMLVLGRFHDAFVQGKVSDANTVAAAAAIFGVGTMLGAVAMQMKALTKGQDPQPMDNKEFWQRAFMQSGGVGIFGDFIANSTNRFGSGLASTIMGPVPDVAGTVLDATVGNVSQYARDEPTNMGREGVNLLRKMTPGAFVPFYLRSAYERMILDELQQMVDPEAHKVFRRRRQSLKKNSGSDFYWPPGQSSPDRGPNFGSVVSQ